MKRSICIVVALLSTLMLVSTSTAVPNINTGEKEINVEEFTKELVTFLFEHPKLKLNPDYREGFFYEFYDMALQIMEDCCKMWGKNPIGVLRGSIRVALVLFIPLRLATWVYYMDGVEILPDLSEEERETLGVYGVFLYYVIMTPICLSLFIPICLLGVRCIHVDVFLDIMAWCTYQMSVG